MKIETFYYLKPSLDTGDILSWCVEYISSLHTTSFLRIFISHREIRVSIIDYLQSNSLRLTLTNGERKTEVIPLFHTKLIKRPDDSTQNVLKISYEATFIFRITLRKVDFFAFNCYCIVLCTLLHTYMYILKIFVLLNLYYLKKIP